MSPKVCSKCGLPEGQTIFNPSRPGLVCTTCRVQQDRLRNQRKLQEKRQPVIVKTFSDPFGWWVTGLADGEGSFIAAAYVGPHRNKNRNGRVTISTSSNFHAVFTLALRDDDGDTIQKLASYFACGRIDNKKPSCSQTTNTHPQKRFTVNRLEELIGVVIPHFEKYPLQSRKVHDFEVWKRIVLFVHQNLYGKKRWVKHYPTELAQIQEMCSELRSVRQYPEAGVVLQ